MTLALVPGIAYFVFSPSSPYKHITEKNSDSFGYGFTYTLILIGIDLLLLLCVWLLGSKKSSPLLHYLEHAVSEDCQRTYLWAIILMLILEVITLAMIFASYLLRTSFDIFFISINIGYMQSASFAAQKELGIEKLKQEKFLGMFNRIFYGCIIIPIAFYLVILSYPQLLAKLRVLGDESFDDTAIMLIFCIGVGGILFSVLIGQFINKFFLSKMPKEMIERMPGIEDYPEIWMGYNSMTGILIAEIITILFYVITGNVSLLNIFFPLSILLAFFVYSRTNDRIANASLPDYARKSGLVNERLKLKSLKRQGISDRFRKVTPITKKASDKRL